jgi:TrmH family RNA methyltransferase
VIDGWRILTDLVRWGHPIVELYLARSRVDHADELVGAVSGEAFVVDDSVLGQLAPTRHPQGVLAVVAEPEWSAWQPAGVTVLLDGVQDPGNVGAVIRSAAALKASAVLLAPGCADPWAPAAVRGSSGAVFRVPVLRSVAVGEAIAATHAAGGQAWATGDGGTAIDAWCPVPPLLALFGGEGAGLDDRWRRSADGTVSIPLERGIDSLNLAVAAGIVLERARASGATAQGAA